MLSSFHEVGADQVGGRIVISLGKCLVYDWIVWPWGCVDQCVALVAIALSIVFGVQHLKYFHFANDVLLLSSFHEVSADQVGVGL